MVSCDVSARPLETELCPQKKLFYNQKEKKGLYEYVSQTARKHLEFSLYPKSFLKQHLDHVMLKISLYNVCVTLSALYGAGSEQYEWLIYDVPQPKHWSHCMSVKCTFSSA